MKKQFVIRDQAIRDRVVAFVLDLPLDHCWQVVITPFKARKTRAQEEKYHAMIHDITPRFVFMGRRDWDEEDVKRLLLDAFARTRHAMREPLMQGGRVVPSLDGSGVVQLGVQSRRLTVDEAADFIEFLYAYGTELGVKWNH